MRSGRAIGRAERYFDDLRESGLLTPALDALLRSLVPPPRPPHAFSARSTAPGSSGP